jgi:hypothetical protein
MAIPVEPVNEAIPSAESIFRVYINQVEIRHLRRYP